MSTEIPTRIPVESTRPLEPTIAENLALVSQQTDRLEAELQALAGANNYPDWWMQEAVPLGTVKRQLQDPSINPTYISEYFQLWKRQQQIRSEISGYDDGTNPLASVYYELGVDAVAKGFLAEDADGPIHVAVLDGLKNAGKKYAHIAPELDVLRQAYGKDTVTGTLGIGGGDGYGDALRPLLRSEHTIRAMRFADQERADDDTLNDTRAKTLTWMSYALSIATDVGEAEAAEYVFAASRRGEDKSFAEMLDRFDRMGVDRLSKFADFTGIHAFENYNVDQLALMEELLRDPRTTAERLLQHDVNVVMVNRVGDHNGIMANTAECFDDGNGRTLFFEINSMADIYRHMLKLRKLGIRPSTLVLAAHSAPGQFMVSDDRDPSMKRRDMATIAGRSLVHFVNNNNLLGPGDYGYSMHGMKGMARVVEDLMHPSRAVDDAKEDAGRKRILFQACDAASETASLDIDQGGEKSVVGMDSVVNRLGSDLVANGVQSNVDIYGAPAGIQLHKSKRGVRYTGQPSAIGEERQRQHAVRIRIEGGKLTRQEVDEVVMHNGVA